MSDEQRLAEIQEHWVKNYRLFYLENGYDGVAEKARLDVSWLLQLVDHLRTENQRLESEAAVLRSALQWYADDPPERGKLLIVDENREFIADVADMCERARKALAADAGRKLLDESRRKDERIRELETKVMVDVFEPLVLVGEPGPDMHARHEACGLAKETLTADAGRKSLDHVIEKINSALAAARWEKA